MIQNKQPLSINTKNPYRLTAALQAFLNAAKIMSEPSIAYQEYIECVGIEKADNELALFRKADNLNPNIYLDFALEKCNDIEILNTENFKSGELKSINIPKKLHTFETNIIILKKALSIKSQGLSDYKVMLKLTDWMYYEYKFSAPSFHFLSIYFSSQRISKMIKSSNINDIKNATWDICFLQELVKFSQKDIKTRWLFSTFDSAIIKTSDLTFTQFHENDTQYFRRLEEEYSKMWGKKNQHGKELLDKIMQYTKQVNSLDRNINIHNGSHEYILKIRKKVNDEFDTLSKGR